MHLTVHICMSPTYTSMFPICHGGLCRGTSTLVHGSDISGSVIASICLSVHNSHTSCSPSLWVASALDWMPTMYAMLHAVDLFFSCSVFIISQASTTTAMTSYSSCHCCMLQYIISPLTCYHGALLDGASNDIRSA